ncbi:MAG: class I SAM-dependent methyltransferase, partial [Planctomycetota bacterium]
MPDDPTPPRPSYESLWDGYASNWNKIDKPGEPRHLGDEWGAAREWNWLFHEFLQPWLAPDKRVLEIGPGGGKYTVMAGPLVRELVAIDVSEKMVALTTQRVAEAGLRNVRVLKGNGLDLSAVENESIDVVFSFDVFVHLAPVDTYAYLREMQRVLKRGGIGSLTLANILSNGGFQKFVSEVERHRGGRRGAEQGGY